MCESFCTRNDAISNPESRHFVYKMPIHVLMRFRSQIWCHFVHIITRFQKAEIELLWVYFATKNISAMSIREDVRTLRLG